MFFSSDRQRYLFKELKDNCGKTCRDYMIHDPEFANLLKLLNDDDTSAHDDTEKSVPQMVHEKELDKKREEFETKESETSESEVSETSESEEFETEDLKTFDDAINMSYWGQHLRRNGWLNDCFTSE